ncbi:MAG: hypothetical protein AAF602_12650, partial [Myxococcota bacterium]
ELRKLAGQMIAFDPGERPDAVEVVTTALELLPQIPGSDLRTWASQHVEVETGSGGDRTADVTVMREEISDTGLPALTPVPPPPRAHTERRGWGMAVMAGGAALLGLSMIGAWTVRPAGEAITALPVMAESVVQFAPALPAVTSPEPAPRPDVVTAPPPPRPAVLSPPAAESPRVSVRFVVDEGLRVTTAHGDVTRSPQLLPLPAESAVEVQVTEGRETWSCTISVDTASRDVHIRPAAAGGCQQ